MWPFCDRCCCCCCCRCLSPMLLLLFRFYLVAYCFCDFYLSVWFISVACFAIKKKKGKTKNKRESLLWSQRVNSARMSNSNSNNNNNGNNSGKFYANVAFPMLSFVVAYRILCQPGLCELWHHKTAATQWDSRTAGRTIDLVTAWLATCLQRFETGILSL